MMMEIVEGGHFRHPEAIKSIMEVRETLKRCKQNQRVARTAFVEHVITIALQLPPSELAKAKSLISDMRVAVTSKKDGIEEDAVQPVLWRAAQELAG